jgi:RNA polymerase sigma-70 factor (ECF subfamily)
VGLTHNEKHDLGLTIAVNRGFVPAPGPRRFCTGSTEVIARTAVRAPRRADAVVVSPAKTARNWYGPAAVGNVRTNAPPGLAFGVARLVASAARALPGARASRVTWAASPVMAVCPAGRVAVKLSLWRAATPGLADQPDAARRGAGWLRYPTGVRLGPPDGLGAGLNPPAGSADTAGTMVDIGELTQALPAARRGDPAAFARLFRALQPALLRYLKALDPGSAEDVAAETWLVCATRLASFRGEPGALPGWLFTVARRKSLDAARARRRRPQAGDAPVAEVAWGVSPDAADEALNQLSTESALALVSELPREQAEAVLLRVLVGLDVAEVARIVGASPGAVRVRTHRGLRSLAARLERFDPAVTR